MTVTPFNQSVEAGRELAINHQVEGEPFIEPSGRALFFGDCCQYADDIHAADLVAANFDVKDIHTGGGLYLFVHVKDGRLNYRCCRRAMRVPDGIVIDWNGRGEWKKVASMADTVFRVVGVVETVYKAVRYQ